MHHNTHQRGDARIPARQWNGEPDAMLLPGAEGNPWLQYPDGRALDFDALAESLAAIGTPPRLWAEGGCDSCGHYVAGAIEGMDFPSGIQRCDECETFDSDLAAAKALADYLGDGLTVWYATESERS